MGDLVPISKQELAINGERELARIGSVIDNRRKYFEKTYVPHPRSFDAQGYIRALNALEPLLRERAERELLVQGVEMIERLACGFGLAGRREESVMSEVIKTPAEIQLEELRRLRREAQKLVELQQRSWEELNWWVYCGADCVYPDLCIPKRKTISTGCILHRLTRLSEASIWRRMLSWERLETVIDPDVLEEIRSSDFYDSSHEPYFERIRREKHERVPVHIRRHGREGR